MALPLGTPAPDFTLRSMGPDGPTDLNLNTYRGDSPLLLLFFPGAFTGVCTAEACSFRDGMDSLKKVNAKILGVSVDSFFAQAAWAKQNELEFPLASDYEHKVTQAYDVVWPNFAGMGPGAARAVFAIDGQGIIRYVEVTENPGVQVNVESAIAALGALPTTTSA